MVRAALFTSLVAAASAVLGEVNRVPGRYLVELEKGHDESSIIKALDGGASTYMKFDHELFQGLSLQFHDVHNAEKNAKKIANMTAAKNVWPVRLAKIPDRHVRVVATLKGGKIAARGNEPADTYSPHVMTQVDRLRAQGITGKGIKIALIDTGIDYSHPALGNGCFGKKGCLVSFGTDLVGDAYTGLNDPMPDNDPMDCAGHGTHVAGIVAAQKNPYGFTGAAPGVTLGAYRVAGCNGAVAATDVLVSAYNKAFEDGAHIISASLGFVDGWTEEPLSVVVSRIVERGVPCTVAAGNDGQDGLFSIASPADAKKGTAVASYNNALIPVASYHSKYSINGGRKVDFTYTSGNASAWDVSMPLYATSLDATIANDACAPLPRNTPDLSKYIVLVRRGACTFAQKAKNIAAKGAKYMMVYNNVAGTLRPDFGDATSRFKATGGVTREVGASWVKSLKAGSRITLDFASPAKARFDLSYINNNVSGGAISTLTSWGPTWDMDFKPQIGAPGGDILSTWPVAKGSYVVYSGTSMSAPMVAAIIALISQVRGTRDPELINDLLSATAKPQLFNDGTKFYGRLASAAQQGGGLVQAYDAAYATSLLYPSSLSFNDTDNFAAHLNFSISNKGKRSVTYKLGHVPAMTMYTLQKNSVYPMAFPNEAVDAQATLAFSQNSVTLAPGQRAFINVSPKAPDGLDAKRLPLWSGYITVNGTDGSALSLPYQGLAGSLHSATVLESDQSWVTLSNDTEAFAKSPDNSRFVVPAAGTSTDDDVLPAAYVNLALGSAQLRLDIVPMTTPPPKDLTTEFMGIKTIGQPFGMPTFLNPRGKDSTSWDGQLDSGKYAPAGKYKFVARALKIHGDARNVKDWDMASTQPFYLEYKKK